MKLNRKVLRRLILQEIKRNLREERTEQDDIDAAEYENQVQNAIMDMAAMPNFTEQLDREFVIEKNGFARELFDQIEDFAFKILVNEKPFYSLDKEDKNIRSNQPGEFEARLVIMDLAELENIKSTINSHYDRAHRAEKRVRYPKRPNFSKLSDEEAYTQYKEYQATPQYQKADQQMKAIQKRLEASVKAEWSKYRLNPNTYRYGDEKHLHLVIPTIRIDIDGKIDIPFKKGEPVSLTQLMDGIGPVKGLVNYQSFHFAGEYVGLDPFTTEILDDDEEYEYIPGPSEVQGSFVIKIQDPIELRELFDILDIDFDPDKMKTDDQLQRERQPKKRTVIGTGTLGDIFDDEI